MPRTRLDDYRESAEAALQLFCDLAGDDADMLEILAGLWELNCQRDGDSALYFTEFQNLWIETHLDAECEPSKFGTRTVDLSVDDAVSNQRTLV